MEGVALMAQLRHGDFFPLSSSPGPCYLVVQPLDFALLTFRLAPQRR
jgi:hypothetical protein